MKINQPHETADVELQSRLRRAETHTDAKPAQASTSNAGSAYAPAKDEIRVSSRAHQIAKLTERALQVPDVRTERVERLREQVLSSSYNPPAAAIADAIFKHEH